MSLTSSKEEVENVDPTQSAERMPSQTGMYELTDTKLDQSENIKENKAAEDFKEEEEETLNNK